MDNNPFNLKPGQKILVKHIPSNSPWMSVEITFIDDNGYPHFESRNFYDILDEKYETDQVIPFEESKLGKVLEEKNIIKKEAEFAWMERARRDKKKYSNEYSAFEFYWNMTH